MAEFLHEVLSLTLVLLIIAVMLTVVAARLRIPYAVLLVIGGAVLGFIPGLPYLSLDPALVLLIFLPPLIYFSAWFTSWRNFRKELRSIVSLAVGLVLATILCVAIVAHMVIPDLSWPSAFVLGAVVSPTDAVAAESIMQSLGLNRRVATIISGESLVNDATGLVAYRFAIAAVSTGTFSLLNASAQFIFVSIGGIAIGLAIAWLAVRLHHWADNPLNQTIISIVTPFATYLIAESLSTSGVIAVVAGGIYLGRQSANFFAANTRLQSDAFWRVLIFLLNALIFLLIGIQLGHLNIGEASILLLIEYAALISLTVIVVRLAWGLAFSFLLRLLNKLLPFHYQPMLELPALLIIGWSGMRGGISMATALAIPTVTAMGSPFPSRDTIIFISFGVILSTLLLQGLTLGPLIRRLGLHDDPTEQEEKHLALQTVTQAALSRLEELKLEGGASIEAIEHLRAYYEKKLGVLVQDTEEALQRQRHKRSTLQQLSHDIHQAERQALIGLRNSGVIDDGVFHSIEHDLDLEDQRLRGR